MSDRRTKIFAALIIASSILTLTHIAAAQQPAPLALIPQPRETRLVSTIPLTKGIAIEAPGGDVEDTFAAEDLKDTLHSYGIEQNAKASVRVILLRKDNSHAREALETNHIAFDPAMHDEGYALIPKGDTLYVIAETSAGVFYGAQTVKQLVTKQTGSWALQAALIRDWPALSHRAADDDLSRSGMPTLEYQKKQIRTFAAFKLNAYSPYFEFTLRYSGNPVPAPSPGTLTREDVAALVRYAQQYHITIIPEQEAFGHLYRVLAYDKYLDLGETPHGDVLAPGEPGSLQLIKSWFTEIAQNFPGPYIHIGADETFGLGRGKTQSEVQKRGLGPVYVDFLLNIAHELAPLQKKILFWGDVAMNDPEQVKRLPKDLIAVPWWYDPEPSFDKYIKPFTDAGLETWVAPGVDSWLKVYPNNDVALRNIQGFLRDGQRMGAKGAITTMWNDQGETLFDQVWYGMLFGAAASWQQGESSIPQYQQSFAQAFHNDWSGKINQAQFEIIAAHQALEKVKIDDASNNLFWLDPWSHDGQTMADKIRPALRDLRLHAEQAITLVEQAKDENPDLTNRNALDALELGARRMDFIGMKFEFADEMAAMYSKVYAEQNDPAKNDEVDALFSLITDMNDGRCDQLRDGYTFTRELYEDAWKKENRPYWLGNVQVRYEAAQLLWHTRCTQLRQLFDDHDNNKIPLPPASSLGIPTPKVP
ncbi:beta-N-acetylhexosaminidase [Alloacidobacterium dinghuense]|uniref:beta-N-acetylhexosaminidase n=1 Tax=Alloacidobacterium dinghuense TaxID=2763107 RepID=A0A7G8BFN2_9BACT|nr:glycoside hydrolase family 20 zincin-like fold domain-containing protein [Alloacidobacterium dinghuense]QNI31352.1 beta-N-acetylhexosaminidase [Alloacidobacterium dinghuense]